MRHLYRFIWRKSVARYAPTLVLLLAACAPATAAPTETATLQPSVTATETLEPTVTMGPTLTSTITTTPWPTETPLPYPTPQVENSQSVGFWGSSPDEKWAAWNICCLEIGPYLLVQNTSNDIEWTVTFDFAERFWWEGGITPSAWSLDGQFLYFKIRGPSDGAYAYDSAAFLRRLNLVTGKTIDVVPQEEFAYFSFAFSPSQDRLVYIPVSKNRVFIRDLQTRSEHAIFLEDHDDFDPGNILWSPDAKKFVFGVERFDPDYEVEIILVNLEDFSGRSIAKFILDRPRPADWISEDEVVLDMGFGTGFKILNINTGELTPVTPQP